MNSGITFWVVSANGVDTQCAYSSNIPLPDMCGPDGRFESSQTDVNESPNNSSLSVDLITNDFNGTTVSCNDGGTGELIDSYNICIIGNAPNGLQYVAMYKVCSYYCKCILPLYHYAFVHCMNVDKDVTFTGCTKHTHI